MVFISSERLGLTIAAVEGGNLRAEQDNEAILPLARVPGLVSRAAWPCVPVRWQSHRRHSPGQGCPYSERGHTGADHSDAGGKTSRDNGHAPGLSEGYVLEPPPDGGLRGSTRRRYVPQKVQ